MELREDLSPASGSGRAPQSEAWSLRASRAPVSEDGRRERPPACAASAPRTDPGRASGSLSGTGCDWLQGAHAELAPLSVPGRQPHEGPPLNQQDCPPSEPRLTAGLRQRGCGFRSLSSGRCYPATDDQRLATGRQPQEGHPEQGTAGTECGGRRESSQPLNEGPRPHSFPTAETGPGERRSGQCPMHVAWSPRVWARLQTTPFLTSADLMSPFLLGPRHRAVTLACVWV